MSPKHAVLVVAALVVAGCGPSADTPEVKAPPRGGYVRVVNLTSTPVSYQINGQTGLTVNPESAGAFTLARPNRDTEIALNNGLPPVKVTVGSEATHSVVLYAGSNGLTTAVLDGDPRNPKDKTGIEFRVSTPVEVDGAVVTIAGMDIALQGKSSEVVSLKAGKHTAVLKINGAEVGRAEVDAQAGRTFSGLIVPKDGGYGFFVTWNNPPMQASIEGASAAG